MPLDSDIKNADANLFVEFYLREERDKPPRDFVKIMIPGDKTNIYDQPVKESHKQRFPMQWLRYQNQNSGPATFGTTLNDWAREAPEDLTDGQFAELLALKFQTVEQVAQASDAQAQRMPMGGIGIRNKAQAYLRRKHKIADPGEVDALKAQLAAMQEQMAALLAKSEPAKRGRKPKAHTPEG